MYIPRLEANSQTQIDPAVYMPTDDNDLYLQYQYIVANPNPVGEKDLLDAAGADSAFTAVHRIIHPILRDFVHEFGFYDLFLIDGSGHIVYTVSKEVDLGHQPARRPLPGYQPGNGYSRRLSRTH